MCFRVFMSEKILAPNYLPTKVSENSGHGLSVGGGGGKREGRRKEEMKGKGKRVLS